MTRAQEFKLQTAAREDYPTKGKAVDVGHWVGKWKLKGLPDKSICEVIVWESIRFMEIKLGFIKDERKKKTK